MTFYSFGYKYNHKLELNYLFDVRVLKNPYYIPELKEKTGMDKEVFDYVFESELTKNYVNSIIAVLKYAKEDYKIGIMCTGGKHRSVAVASYLANYFNGLLINLDI